MLLLREAFIFAFKCQTNVADSESPKVKAKYGQESSQENQHEANTMQSAHVKRRVRAYREHQQVSNPPLLPATRPLCGASRRDLARSNHP